MSKLFEAFQELTQVCRVRPATVEADIAAMARRIFKALGEYPEDVALKALDQWPRQSEWFPTEKELRDLCEELASRAALDAAQRGEAPQGRYLYPIGKTAVFAERARKLYGEDYCKSWLAGGVTCLFTDEKIFTTGLGVDRLTHDLGAAAKELGVEIIKSATATRMLAQYCDARGLKFEPKKGRQR